MLGHSRTSRRVCAIDRASALACGAARHPAGRCNSAHLADVHAERAMDAAAGQADEAAQVGRRPAYMRPQAAQQISAQGRRTCRTGRAAMQTVLRGPRHLLQRSPGGIANAAVRADAVGGLTQHLR